MVILQEAYISPVNPKVLIMSQLPVTPPVRSRLNRHRAVGPYGDLAKQEHAPRNAYFQFKRAKRVELRKGNPGLSGKDLSKEVLKAWSQLSPAERKPTPARIRFTPPSLPAKTEASISSDMEEAETGQSETAHIEGKPGLWARLGGALKQVAGYFLVRPF